MFRLSSSSTFGLWLSLLRRNTKTTFWTILTSTISILSSLNRLQLLHCSRSRKKSPMFPSRIQTTTVMLGQRRSPHLELSKERGSPVSEVSTKLFVVFKMLHLRCSCLVCSLYTATAAQGLLSAIRRRLLALLSWVVTGCWGATSPVSVVTACIISRGGAKRIPLEASPTSSWCTLGYWHILCGVAPSPRLKIKSILRQVKTLFSEEEHQLQRGNKIVLILKTPILNSNAIHLDYNERFRSCTSSFYVA